MSRHQEILAAGLRLAIRDTLMELTTSGVPADCWLRLAVQTTFPGVELPDSVRAEHPHVVVLDIRPAALGPVFRLESDVLVMDTAFGFRTQVRLPLGAIVALEDTVAAIGVTIAPSEIPVPVPEPRELPQNVKPWRARK